MKGTIAGMKKYLKQVKQNLKLNSYYVTYCDARKWLTNKIHHEDTVANKLYRGFKNSGFYPVYYRLLGKTDTSLQEGAGERIWLFNSGNNFSGNPKYLFLYVNKYRKDITPYWICDDPGTVKFVESLGYRAFTFKDPNHIQTQRRAEVFVVEQVKEVIPANMTQVKMLNLWHGVGCKSIERKVNFGFLNERIAKKYITNNAFYKSHQLFLVTSPLMEKHFKEQCGIDDDKVIRAGYPKCLYQKYKEKVVTFDHNIRAAKGLDANTSIAAYVPTYRDGNQKEFFGTAIPDMDRLVAKLQEQNMLLIFKMHPQMEADYHYVRLKKEYANCPNLLFWDQSQDFYEIFDQIDLAIIDYSSIFYDMLVAGVPHFVRYFFDYDKENNLRDMALDLKEMTCGKLCHDFEELLSVLDHYQEEDPKEQQERQRIYDLFWEYSGEDSFEKIIDKTLDFTPDEKQLPTLYSFDIFDTLFSRKVLDPRGIFYYVREKMEGSDLNFPEYLVKHYPYERANAEANVRQFYNRTMEVRHSTWREIKFDQIFSRLATMYDLSDDQVAFLKQTEMEAELENVLPIKERIAFAEHLMASGETVVLISDMYLPQEFVSQMLEKASPALAKLPLFLSSTCGLQKTTRQLYLQVYQIFDEYLFGKWEHFGDNELADETRARQMGILSHRHLVPAFDEYEKALVEKIGTYDAYLVAALMARFRHGNDNPKDRFAYGYVSLYLVPYVIWAVEDAVQRGIQCLYFISRDGYHLKEIADAVVEVTGADIRTKYIYGSRKAWRIPSFIDRVDDEFYMEFGQFEGVTDYQTLLKAASMDDKTFSDMFPGLAYVKDKKQIDAKIRQAIIATLAGSQEFQQYILDQAKKERVLVDAYLKQEIDWTEKMAFVEYWGRGYTQDCFARLLCNVAGQEMDVPFYYARSIYPTQGHFLRYNFSTGMQSLIFMEAIFANIPYKSIASYQFVGEKVEPVIEPCDCDMKLDQAFCKYLPLFAKDLLSSPMLHSGRTMKELFAFSMDYYNEHKEDATFAAAYAPLPDAVTIYGEKREFAPEITPKMLQRIKDGEKTSKLTSSLPMTFARSSEKMIKEYQFLTHAKQIQAEERSRRDTERALVKADIVANESCKQQAKEYQKKKITWQEAYSKYSKDPVKKGSALFFYESQEAQQEHKDGLEQYLKEIGMEVWYLYRADTYTPEQYQMLAQAEFLFLYHPQSQLNLFGIRQETKVVQLGEEAYPFESEPFGKRLKDSMVYQKELLQLERFADYALVAASSEHMVKTVAAEYGLSSGKVRPVGYVDTDCYFDLAFQEASKEKVRSLFPEIGSRKILAYLPAYRTKLTDPSQREVLDLGTLKECLEEDYVLIFLDNTRDLVSKYYIPEEAKGFAKDLTEQISPRELMAAADVVVGDYRKEFFESMLLQKPVFASAGDWQNYYKGKTTLGSYEQIVPALIVRDALDLAWYLKDLSRYDHQKVEQFAKTYLTACDGHACEKLMKALREK